MESFRQKEYILDAFIDAYQKSFIHLCIDWLKTIQLRSEEISQWVNERDHLALSLRMVMKLTLKVQTLVIYEQRSPFSQMPFWILQVYTTAKSAILWWRTVCCLSLVPVVIHHFEFLSRCTHLCKWFSRRLKKKTHKKLLEIIKRQWVAQKWFSLINRHKSWNLQLTNNFISLQKSGQTRVKIFL